MSSVTLFTLFFLCICVLYVSSDEIPTILWNIKGNALNVKQASSFSKKDKLFRDSIEDILKDNGNILAFSMPALSLEDFSSSEKPLSSNNTLQNIQTFLETQPYMLLSSIKDPIENIHQSHCGVQEIVVDQAIDDNVLQSITSAFSRSCVVVLHITESAVGIKDPTLEEIRKVFRPAFDRIAKNIVGIFSAMKSSWGDSNSESRFFHRNLLAAEDTNSFLNLTNCLIANIDSATLWANNKTVNLTMPPTIDPSSKCGKSNAFLKLNFKASVEFTNVMISFNFTSKTGNWAGKVTVLTTGSSSNLNETLESRDLTAPLKYSFSCGSYILKSRKYKTPKFVLEGFQIQPFEVKKAFSESFDCVTWFTIPIWMGIFVALIFIIIINVGVYALFSVHTMDRFDDPKGKSITVAAASD